MIKRYSGYLDFDRWQRRVSQLLDDLSRVAPELSLSTAGAWHPPVDIFENRDEVIVVVEVPGVKGPGISVTLQHNTLLISGKKEEEHPAEQEARFLCLERNYGEFRRVVPLAAVVDPKRGAADLRDGVLTIRLKKIIDSRRTEHRIAVTEEAH